MSPMFRSSDTWGLPISAPRPRSTTKFQYDLAPDVVCYGVHFHEAALNILCGVSSHRKRAKSARLRRKMAQLSGSRWVLHCTMDCRPSLGSPR